MKATIFILFGLAFPALHFGGVEETIDFGDIEDVGIGGKLEKYWKNGTAFFVTADGYLVTDSFIVKDAKRVVSVWRNKAYDAEIIFVDTTNRLAVLKANGVDVKPACISQSQNMKKGTMLKAIGFTASEEDGVGFSMSDCIVSGVSKRRFKAFGLLGESMCGGPLIGSSGEVEGLVIKSGGGVRSESDAISARTILASLPPRIRRKLVFGNVTMPYMPFSPKDHADSLALILVYNEDMRNRAVPTTSAQGPRKSSILSVEDLTKLTVSAQENKTHLAGNGSGFFVSRDGYLITNYHVVEGAKELVVVHNGKTYSADLRAQSREKDLALLKIEGEFVPVCVSGSDEMRVGTTVFVVGFPQLEVQGLEPKVTRGIISSKSGFKGDQSKYQMDAAIQPGNSGGPVANESGCVVGVSVASTYGQNVNYAIKWKTVQDFLPKGVKTAHETTSRKDFSDAVEDVVKSSALILNFKPGSAPLDVTIVAPEKRKELESSIRKQILYARLAKLDERWRDVQSMTDVVLEIDPCNVEARELNELARDELGLHLVIIAEVDGREVSAIIEPICGFKANRPRCGDTLTLKDADKTHDFPVKGKIKWEENGQTWTYELDLFYNWHGTKEVLVKLEKVSN